jgi:hypothetical protein
LARGRREVFCAAVVGGGSAQFPSRKAGLLGEHGPRSPRARAQEGPRYGLGPPGRRRLIFEARGAVPCLSRPSGQTEPASRRSAEFSRRFGCASAVGVAHPPDNH